MLALERFFAVEEAAVWPEVEAQISEGGWIHHNLDARIPLKWGPHALYLADARNRLVDDGKLVDLRATVGGLEVAAWVNPALLAVRGRTTAVRRHAAAKRRIYRRFLVWAGDARLCGDVAEHLVDRTLRALHGTNLWIPPNTRVGQVHTLLGRPITVGGPLDAAGLWARNPQNPNEGFIPFGVEVKNIRSPIYPWSTETWDLLAKMAAFPDVVPVIAARRIHPTAFRFAGQVFSQPPLAIPRPKIDGVVDRGARSCRCARGSACAGICLRPARTFEKARLPVVTVGAFEDRQNDAQAEPWNARVGIDEGQRATLEPYLVSVVGSDGRVTSTMTSETRAL